MILTALLAQNGQALARSFGVVQIKPGFDPLKAQVDALLDLHRLAPQVVAAQIVDVFRECTNRADAGPSSPS